jgi:hypothetical protein
MPDRFLGIGSVRSTQPVPKNRSHLQKGGQAMLKAIADVLSKIGSAVATVVTLPFRAVARLFGGASDTAHGHH